MGAIELPSKGSTKTACKTSPPSEYSVSCSPSVLGYTRNASEQPSYLDMYANIW